PATAREAPARPARTPPPARRPAGSSCTAARRKSAYTHRAPLPKFAAPVQRDPSRRQAVYRGGGGRGANSEPTGRGVTTVTEVFGRYSGHEQVVFCADEASGLRAIIAIYSTALGPALGGTRFHPYPDEDAALRDVLNLSVAMAYKASLAGLDLGGGKAVIIGDPARDKSEALLRAYGRFIQSLGGRY